MSFPLASIAVYNSVVFGVFSNLQRFLSQHHCGEPEAGPGRHLSDLLLASMAAGLVAVGLGGPVDLIKIRLQMQTQPCREANLGLKPRTLAFGAPPVYQGPVHCLSTIVRTEGLAGLYRGASAMLLRDIPGYCLYFIPYVFLSEWITPEAHAGPSPCAVWLAGGVAGAISWGTATPMDVVKSRLQADGVYVTKYRGVLDCVAQSYQQEGLKVYNARDLSLEWSLFHPAPWTLRLLFSSSTTHTPAIAILAQNKDEASMGEKQILRPPERMPGSYELAVLSSNYPRAEGSKHMVLPQFL
ncbi:solute carrier family 25 member 48 isoform X4 [Dipodomys spectabilis]|nr:solute carrier family 25 member 48 isoform X4 [Dipodomys spectabilis]XP_042527264.1 solute carrier family 25 member 48 isoform X4 [Dipodomys spectabilis]